MPTPFSEDADALRLPTLDYDRFTLPNGLTVIVHEDHKSPIVGLALWYRVGSGHEPPGATGFAHLFEHLMFSGSEHFRGSFLTPFESVGATDQNGTTWFDRTNYFVTVPSTALDLAMWMESDRMGHLLGAVGQDELDAQRGVVLNEKRQTEGAPFGRVSGAIQRATYPQNHPYHHVTLGSEEDVTAASLDDVRRWFKTHYGAANATLVLAGDITPVVAREKAMRYFGHIEPGPALPRLRPWIAPLQRPTREVIVDRVSVVRLVRVWNTPQWGHEDVAPLEVAATILGAGPASRLRTRLVVRDRLALDTSTRLRTFALGGQMWVTADMAVDAAPEAVEAAIDEEIQRLAREGPTDDEVSGARMDFIADAIRGAEFVGGMHGKAALLAEGEVIRDDPHAHLQHIREIAVVTPEQVRAACARWIGAAHHTLTVIADDRSAETRADAPVVRAAEAANAQPDEAAPTRFAAEAPAVDRSLGVPAILRFPDLDFPAVRRSKLRNGVEVVSAERRGGELVELRALFGDGAMLDVGRPSGLTGFYWSLLMEGGEDFDAAALESARRSLGAFLSPTRLSALSAKLEPSLRLMAGLLQRPAFRADDIERVRAHLLAAVGRAEATPAGAAERLMAPLLFGADHPYGGQGGGLGVRESLEAIDASMLKAFQDEVVRPDNLRIFAAGDFAHDDLVERLDMVFGEWASPEGTLAAAKIGTVQPPSKPRLYLLDRPGADQTFLLGARVSPTGPGEVPVNYKIANEVLGGSFSSRLNMNLREAKHWTYGAYSRLQTDRVQGRFAMSAAVEAGRSADSLREMIGELQAITGHAPPATAEIERVKVREVRTLPARNETAATVADTLTANAALGRPDDYVVRYKSMVEEVPNEAIVAASSELFHPEAMTWVAVGDLACIEAGLRAVSDVTIVEPAA